MIEVNQINQYYGSSHTLRDVSFSVPKGAVTTVLGRNGVGKTTLLKCLMGVVGSKSGSVMLDGRDITSETPFNRAKLGIGYVPQGREIFSRLTVEENLLMGLATKKRFSKCFQYSKTCYIDAAGICQAGNNSSSRLDERLRCLPKF